MSTEGHTIIWHGDKPEGVEAAVLKDLEEAGLDPDRLIFHTVWLTSDMEGPSVLVWGEEGKFHAEYDEVTILVGVKPEEEA